MIPNVPGVPIPYGAGEHDDPQRPRRTDHFSQLDQQRKLDGWNENEKKQEATHFSSLAQGSEQSRKGSA